MEWTYNNLKDMTEYAAYGMAIATTENELELFALSTRRRPTTSTKLI